MDQKYNFCPISTAKWPCSRTPQSFITSQTEELLKGYLYMLIYFIILYDKNGSGIDVS